MQNMGNEFKDELLSELKALRLRSRYQAWVTIVSALFSLINTGVFAFWLFNRINSKIEQVEQKVDAAIHTVETELEKTKENIEGWLPN